LNLSNQADKILSILRRL